MRNVLLLSLALAACSSGDGPGDTAGTGLDERADRRGDWSRADVADYTYIYSRRYGNGHDPDVQVTVRDHAVTAGRLLDGTPLSGEALAALPTIDGIFDLIDARVAAHVYQLDVQYDPTRGFPVTILVDEDLSTADDEERIAISQFSTP